MLVQATSSFTCGSEIVTPHVFRICVLGSPGSSSGMEICTQEVYRGMHVINIGEVSKAGLGKWRSWTVMHSKQRPQMIPQKVLELSWIAVARNWAFPPTPASPSTYTCRLVIGCKLPPQEDHDPRWSSSLQPKQIPRACSVVTYHCQQRPGGSMLQSWRGWRIWVAYPSIHYPLFYTLLWGSPFSCQRSCDLSTLSQDSIIHSLEFSPYSAFCLPNSYSFFRDFSHRALAWSPITSASHQSTTKLSGFK